jgi:hypothetical protein
MRLEEGCEASALTLRIGKKGISMITLIEQSFGRSHTCSKVSAKMTETLLSTEGGAVSKKD